MSSKIQNQYVPDFVTPPGETLLETIEALGISQAELAERTGRPRKTINEIIKGITAITPETALQLEYVTGVPATFWNNRERIYRESLARQAEQERLKEECEWLKELPVRHIIKAGWVIEYKDKVQQLKELLSFFGVATPDAWREGWARMEVAFRKPKAFDSHPGAVAAWLRKGEIDAQKIHCAPFDAEKFKATLTEIRRLTVELPEVFEPSMKKACAASGVAVVFVKELPGTCACGATRWLNPIKALVQLSLRYKVNDHLWHTFFHEAGHILLHGKREAFIECDDGKDEKEREADNFAANFLVPPEARRRFVRAGDFTQSAVENFAAELGIAPGIVVGQLQHEKHLPYNQLNHLKIKLKWVE